MKRIPPAGSVLIMILVLTHLHSGVSCAGADAAPQETRVVSDFSYPCGPGDSPEIARALSLFGAKYEAVLISAGRLAERGLLKDYGDKRMEIFCLATDELNASIVSASFSEKTNICTSKVKCSVALSDFVRAEIRNAALEEEERHFSFQQEMEPIVAPAIAPAKELSRAYRYLRKHQWRMAIIYLDHLEKKYRHWSALFLAKARGFQGMHRIENAEAALSTACQLGSQEACREKSAATATK
jgi:hypothetical protein